MVRYQGFCFEDGLVMELYASRDLRGKEGRKVEGGRFPAYL
jgi:hypothetical protein